MEQPSHSQDASFKPGTFGALGLEPELRFFHPKSRNNKLLENALIEINQELKAFKHQSQNDTSPTALDIRKFIKEQRYSPHGNGPHDISTIHHIKKAEDLVVYYMIEQINQSNNPHDALEIFKHTEVGNTPLFLDIFDKYLWRSVALMVVSGIDPSDYGRTLHDIAKGCHTLSAINDDDGDMYRILDLCAFSSACLEQYFTFSFRDLNEYRDEARSARELTKYLLERTTESGLIRLYESKEEWATSNFNDECVRWYHIPFPNSLIVEVQQFRFESISSSHSVQSLLSIFDHIQATRIFHKQFRLSAVTPGNSYLTFREHMYWSSRELGDSKLIYSPINTPQLPNAQQDGSSIGDGPVIVIPTLMLTTLLQHNEKRKEYVAMMEKVTKLRSKWLYSYSLHPERTLDEAYFPGLDEKELLERNKDQIVSREYPSNYADKPIVIVTQLWLWRFGSVIISAHGIPRISEGFHRGDSPMYKMINKINEDWVQFFPATHKFFSSTRYSRYQMVHLISQHITSFGNTGITSLESALSGCPSIDEKMTKDDISSNTELPRKGLPILDYFERHVVRTLSRVKQYMGRAESTQIDFEKEKQFHHDLSDCRSELAMIRHVLKQQREVINAFRIDVEKDSKLDQCKAEQKATDTRSLRLLDECLFNLDKYEDKALKIDGDAERVEKIVQDLLNLKRTYTSAQDSHAGVLLGVAAGAFAIITIFFAPLAFLTALFALKIQGFERLMVTNSPKELNADADGSDPIYSGGKIAGILISSVILTFMITGSLMFAAMKWLNIDMKDLKFRQNNSEEGKDNPTEDQVDKNSVKVPASTTDHEKDTGAPETSSVKTNKVFLATAFSAVRKRLSKKNDLEAQ